MSDIEYQFVPEGIPPSTQPRPKPRSPTPEPSSRSHSRKTSQASLPTIAEEGEVKPAERKTTRAKTPKPPKPSPSGEPKKLSRACDKCRKSKIRCTHRQEMDGDSQVYPRLASSPPKKRARKATADPEDQEVEPESQTQVKRIKLTVSKGKDKGKEPVTEAAESATATRKTRGRPRKRAADELASEEDEESNPPAAKRSKNDEQRASAEPAQAPVPPARRKRPAEANMSGSIWLTHHEQWHRRLGDKLVEFEKQSAEANAAYREAKETYTEIGAMIASWREGWGMGL